MKRKTSRSRTCGKVRERRAGGKNKNTRKEKKGCRQKKIQKRKIYQNCGICVHGRFLKGPNETTEEALKLEDGGAQRGADST